jgi:hypothetical protein
LQRRQRGSEPAPFVFDDGTFDESPTVTPATAVLSVASGRVSTAQFRRGDVTDKSTLAMIAAAAMLAIASTAFAQVSDSIRTKEQAAGLGRYARATAVPARTTANRNDPALTGGGSLGYNQRVEQGY